MGLKQKLKRVFRIGAKDEALQSDLKRSKALESASNAEVQPTSKIRVLIERIHTYMGGESPRKCQSKVERIYPSRCPHSTSETQQNTCRGQRQEGDTHGSQEGAHVAYIILLP